jgi:hypothetical protein
VNDDLVPFIVQPDMLRKRRSRGGCEPLRVQQRNWLRRLLARMDHCGNQLPAPIAHGSEPVFNT